ncbi:MAG: leucine-rich repeat protein, partial [Paludibacteraceae bacterium]|nr:leucine-rich repeat protein [Paludibacteraceae bacterium]
CTSLRQVNLPSTVTRIEDNGFEGSGLTSIVLPSSMTSVESYVFSGCVDLKYIEIPAGISSFSVGAFEHCMFDTIRCYATTPPEMEESFESDGTNAVVLIPFGTLAAYQGNEYWGEFSNLVEMPCSGSMASGTCGAQGDNLTWVISCDSVLTISGAGAMADYNGSSSVPWHSYQSIIREAVIGADVTSLSIYSTFEECTALESVIIPEGITSLGDYTFNNCTSLEGIDLPSTMTSLGSYCFGGCSGMDSIVSRATTPPTANGSTFGIGDDAIRVYVPVSAIAAYQSAEGWSSFTNFMALPEGCIIASGTCGADGYNIVWVLDCDSVMTISGTGEMASYTTNSNGQAPWASYGSQIRDIVIGEGITKASPYGFYNAGSYTNGAYNNVRSVTIPSTMNTLANNNFYQCPIETVTINSDSIVGRTTYSSSSNLQNIFGAQVRQYVIGSSVHSIAQSAFYNQSADSLRSVILPEGLTSIGDWGFGYLENMDSITLPSTLQSIGADAFYGSGLKAITIPAGVTTMGGQAFQNCDKLTSLTLEEGLTSIGTSAFANCTALPEVTIPESMQTISSGAFTGCTNLTKVTVLSSTWVGETKSSSSITKQAIGGYVRELILGDQITTIGKYAFSGLDSLRSVTLPANLEIVGIEAFSSCKKLQSITLPSTVTTLGNYAFNGCTALDSIRLNEGLLRIGAQVFYQCTSLQRVTLPSSLIGINGTSFYGCTGLTEMTLPDGALHPDSLGNNIFGGCTNLTKLTINSRTLCEGTYTTSQNLKTNFGQDALRTLIIGEGVTSIGNYAFYNSSISTLVLPSTLTSVGNGSFGSCSSLTNVTSNALAAPTIQSGSFSKQDTLNVLCAAKEAYQTADYWKNFTTILADCAGGYCGGENNEENVIWSLSGEGVLTITGTGKMASYQSDTIVPWYGHRAEILSVIISEGVESITPYAFLQCWNLASVTIPSTVNSIGGLAFGHCSSLESVTIPKGITYIEGYTFTGCTSLSSIEIPASVTQIANEAFSGCTSLGNIYCRGAYPPVDDLQNAFKNIDTSIVTVFVPSRSINLYKAADGWKKFSNIRGQDDANLFTMPVSTEWQFIMLPGINGDQWCGLPADSILSDSTLVWARYVGAFRAQGQSGWQLFDPNASSNEGRFLCTDAYIVRANGSGATLTMKVPVDAANMTSVTYTYEKHTARHAENANWNFVGNPFPYYYNILAQLDALGITTPITIWNGTGYELFTPGIDTERMLAPFEAFFIQVPEDVESVVITFSGEYIIM